MPARLHLHGGAGILNPIAVGLPFYQSDFLCCDYTQHHFELLTQKGNFAAQVRFENG